MREIGQDIAMRSRQGDYRHWALLAPALRTPWRYPAKELLRRVQHLVVAAARPCLLCNNPKCSPARLRRRCAGLPPPRSPPKGLAPVDQVLEVDFRSHGLALSHGHGQDDHAEGS